MPEVDPYQTISWPALMQLMFEAQAEANRRMSEMEKAVSNREMTQEEFEDVAQRVQEELDLGGDARSITVVVRDWLVGSDD